MTFPTAASESHSLAARWEERVMRAAHPLAYPLLRSVRSPVRRLPGVGVVVTDATLLRSVLMNTAGFTKTGPGSSSDLWTPVLGPSLLLNMEGEEHLALRRKLAPIFAPSYVDGLVAASLGDAARQLTASLRRGDAVDMVTVARTCASTMITQLVGLPPRTGNGSPAQLERQPVSDQRADAPPAEGADADAAIFERVSSITGFVRLSRPRLTEAQVAFARSVVADLTSNARTAYADGDESTVPGRMRALGLSEDEALGAVAAFVLTGTETLVSYIPRLVALLADSGWLARIAADRSLLEAAIAEGLRVTTPSPVMVRSAASDSSINGVRVNEGDRVILATFAANRALGPFDPARNPSTSLKQLWFGAGSHFCLGAPLAMAQIRVIVSALLDGMPTEGNLAVSSRSPARHVLIPSYRSLVVKAV